MQILLSHEDINEIIQERLQGAVEDHVRSQINIAADQALTINITNNGGLFGATIGISKSGSPMSVTAPKGPIKRGAKSTATPSVAPTTVVLTEPTPEEEVAAITALTDEADAIINDDEPMSVEKAPEPTPFAAAKPASLFAKKPVVVSDDPTADLPDDVPAEAAGAIGGTPEPIRKGIFSFAKGGAA